MKLFADYNTGDGYKRINIWDIYNGYNNYISNEKNINFAEYYNKFYKGKLFSTHRKTKFEMILIKNEPYSKSFFRYLPNINCRGKLESITHSTYKDIIQELCVLNLRIDNKNIKLFVARSDIEVEFVANGNTYYADVFIDFYKSEPAFYYYKWNGKLCFEINYSHPVEKKKAHDCMLEGIAVFEHTISSKLTMNEHTTTEEILVNQRNFILERLSEVIYGKLLSDPVVENYKNTETLIKENLKLEKQNTELSNRNKILLDINYRQSNEILKLENRNSALEKDNAVLLNANNFQSTKVVELEQKILQLEKNASALEKDNAVLLNANNFQSNKIIQLEQKVLQLERYENMIEKNKFFRFIIKLFRVK